MAIKKNSAAAAAAAGRPGSRPVDGGRDADPDGWKHTPRAVAFVRRTVGGRGCDGDGDGGGSSSSSVGSVPSARSDRTRKTSNRSGGGGTKGGGGCTAVWWPSVLYPSWRSAALDRPGFMPADDDDGDDDEKSNRKKPATVLLDGCKRPTRVSHLAKNVCPAKAALGPRRRRNRNRPDRVVRYHLGIGGTGGDGGEWGAAEAKEVRPYELDVARAVVPPRGAAAGGECEWWGDYVSALEEASALLGDENLHPDRILGHALEAKDARAQPPRPGMENAKTKGKDGGAGEDEEVECTPEFYDDWKGNSQTQPGDSMQQRLGGGTGVDEGGDNNESQFSQAKRIWEEMEYGTSQSQSQSQSQFDAVVKWQQTREGKGVPNVGELVNQEEKGGEGDAIERPAKRSCRPSEIERGHASSPPLPAAADRPRPKNEDAAIGECGHHSRSSPHTDESHPEPPEGKAAAKEDNVQQEPVSGPTGKRPRETQVGAAAVSEERDLQPRVPISAGAQDRTRQSDSPLLGSKERGAHQRHVSMPTRERPGQPEEKAESGGDRRHQSQISTTREADGTTNNRAGDPPEVGDGNTEKHRSKAEEKAVPAAGESSKSSTVVRTTGATGERALSTDPARCSVDQSNITEVVSPCPPPLAHGARGPPPHPPHAPRADVSAHVTPAASAAAAPTTTPDDADRHDHNDESQIVSPMEGQSPRQASSPYSRSSPPVVAMARLTDRSRTDAPRVVAAPESCGSARAAGEVDRAASPFPASCEPFVKDSSESVALLTQDNAPKEGGDEEFAQDHGADAAAIAPEHKADGRCRLHDSVGRAGRESSPAWEGEAEEMYDSCDDRIVGDAMDVDNDASFLTQ